MADFEDSGARRISMDIITLDQSDAGELLTLQRAAYAEQAQLHRDPYLPPLLETLTQVEQSLAQCLTLGIRDNGRLVAAVRLQIEDDVAHLGRLVVAPDRQGQGLGSRLVEACEKQLPTSAKRIELFTGEHSHGNLLFYSRHGFTEIRRNHVTDAAGGTYDLIFMSKDLNH